MKTTAAAAATCRFRHRPIILCEGRQSPEWVASTEYLSSLVPRLICEYLIQPSPHFTLLIRHQTVCVCVSGWFGSLVYGKRKFERESIGNSIECQIMRTDLLIGFCK